MDRFKRAFIVIGVATMVLLGGNLLTEAATGDGYLNGTHSHSHSH